MHYILLPQLTCIKLFCIKMTQRPSTRFERYRYVVWELWLSWNVRFLFHSLVSLFCSNLIRQKKALSGIFTWFFCLSSSLPSMHFTLHFKNFLPYFFSISVSTLPCCWYPFYCLITGRPCSVFPYEKERLTVFEIQIFTSHLAVNML